MRAKYIDVTKNHDESIFDELGQAIRERKVSCISYRNGLWYWYQWT